MKKITAVLLDTVSIQKYVFSGNKLKENLGASYLVDDIFRDQLKQSVERVFKDEQMIVDVDNWKNETVTEAMMETCPFFIGYIGGGNALLFFHEKSKGVEFVKEWSTQLLIEAPGLTTAVAVQEFPIKDCLTNKIDDIYKELAKNKNRYYPNVALHQYGVTADCPRSGYSIETYDQTSESFVSSVTKSKLKVAKTSTNHLIKQFENVLTNQYTFTDEIDKLGQTEGNSHIGVVHIDGNSMGQQFRKCTSLQDVRNLSKKVDEVTSQAFARLLEIMIDQINIYEDIGLRIQTDQGRKILPIRPIIMSGDDVTFVTDGRLGVYLAEKFIDLLTNNDEKLAITACAGVAITKTKYPFYRGYILAEELCAEAKREARKNDDTSWLDFHVSYGSFSGYLSDVREKKLKTKGGNLHFGPYQLSSNQHHHNEEQLSKLKECLFALSTHHWPRSKIKELRSILPLGKERTIMYIKELRSKGLALPKFSNRSNYENNGWENSRTPYFDMIELQEFYPFQLLEEELKKDEATYA